MDKEIHDIWRQQKKEIGDLLQGSITALHNGHQETAGLYFVEAVKLAKERLDASL